MHKPELLAPAGNLEALRSALIGGADAVYFGLSVGFNARAKSSADLTPENLPAILEEIHGCGAKAHITLNTLVFEDELGKVKDILLMLEKAGVDAIIIQDIGVALLAKRYAPHIQLHASTQMTVTCSPAADFARQLGMSRVVLPRELSLEEIERVARHTPLETEVFILGALCMSYSGQCLASLSWGGRSANRGQCAQACRLPYQAIIDGQTRRPADHPAHLFSPRDQAGLTEVADLARIGVDSLKVEGRLKGPNYVYMASSAVRRRLDELDDRDGVCRTAALRRDFTDLNLTFSRGFGHGFLRGIDHKGLVSPLSPQHHGVYLGRVLAVRGRTLTVPRQPESSERSGESGPDVQTCLPVTPQKGMGVLIIPASAPPTFQNPNPGLGGPLFDVRKNAKNYELTFGHIGPSLEKVRPGDQVFITSSPILSAQIKQALKSAPTGRRALTIKVSGQEGGPLRISARTAESSAEISSDALLQKAQRRALDESALREAFSALGGTPYHLAELNCSALADGLFLPLSELKPLRRRLLEALQNAVPEEKTASSYRAFRRPQPEYVPAETLPHLSVLCRTEAQVRAALECQAAEIELEFNPRQEQYAAMDKLVRQHPEVSLTLTTPRIHKDGEEHFLDRLVSQGCRRVMVRSLGALVYLRNCEAQPLLDGDFSLNVTNSLSARYFFRCGLQRLVLSDDLDLKHACQLSERLTKYSAADLSQLDDGDGSLRLNQRLIMPIYRHIPAFYTQHCFFAEYLSPEEHPAPGRCGMPCRKHTLAFQDRLGQVHPLSADSCCRNTLYDSLAKNTTEHLETYWRHGLRQFRVEFLQENYAEACALLQKVRKQLQSLRN